MLLSVHDLPEGVTPDPSAVRVTLAGDAAPAQAQLAAEAVGDDVAVALVGFADEATVIAEATTDRTALEQAIGGLRLSPRTRLYDGKQSGVKVDVVALQQGAAQQSLLEKVAIAGYGQVIDIAGPEDLAALFAEQAAAPGHRPRGAGLLGPWLYLGVCASRRIKKFNAQLAGTLGRLGQACPPVCRSPSRWTRWSARAPNRSPGCSDVPWWSNGSASGSRTPWTALPSG